MEPKEFLLKLNENSSLQDTQSRTKYNNEGMHYSDNKATINNYALDHEPLDDPQKPLVKHESLDNSQKEKPSDNSNIVDDEDWEFIAPGSGPARTGKSREVLPPYTFPRKEKYPVENLISIPPPGKTKLATVQADFTIHHESDMARTIRLQRLEKIRQVFKISYDQYKRVGWGYDEISPVTEHAANPFLGWAANMVDAMDTMQIMGLKDDFEDAVKFVANIDFQKTFREAIPIFETVIRYLGGLISAYDLSGGSKTILLEKAVELADNLMGAFDTPNRMPLLFYQWQDKDTKVRKRAGADSSFAELGSLTVEFTHLAQLTKDNKYYDAVARITDAIYELAPNTILPGLFPLSIDLSGCNVSLTGKLHGTSKNEYMEAQPQPVRPIDAGNGGRKTVPQSLHGDKRLNDDKKPLEDKELSKQTIGDPIYALPEEIGSNELFKRSLDTNNNSDLSKYQKVIERGEEGFCIPMGIRPGKYNKIQTFSMGGLADSAYEYFIKSYQLLRGGESKYMDLYQNMVESAKQHLIFKPWVPNNENILFIGTKKQSFLMESYLNEMTHLTCFAGGMFALGGKLLDRAEDVDIGKKITEGCVWAYNSTRTGIMPEKFTVRKCPEEIPHCEFDLEKALEYDKTQKSWSRAPPMQFIPDENGGERWAVSRMYDMPRSFINGDSRYLLRPEAIESVFYMYRITGDTIWQEKGWKMFEAIVGATEVVNPNTKKIQGYSAINDVTKPIASFDDSAESFWLAETLKYFYLLFEDPNVISLDDYVFNTEAHPFKIKA